MHKLSDNTNTGADLCTDSGQDKIPVPLPDPHAQKEQSEDTNREIMALSLAIVTGTGTGSLSPLTSTQSDTTGDQPCEQSDAHLNGMLICRSFGGVGKLLVPSLSSSTFLDACKACNARTAQCMRCTASYAVIANAILCSVRLLKKSWFMANDCKYLCKWRNCLSMKSRIA